MMLDTIPNTIRPYLSTAPMIELEELARMVADEIRDRFALTADPELPELPDELRSASGAADRQAAQLELWKTGAGSCAPRPAGPTALGPR